MLAGHMLVLRLFGLIFEAFASQGQQLHWRGEIWHQNSSMPNFIPICARVGCETPKNLDFTKFGNKLTKGTYPLCDSYKIFSLWAVPHSTAIPSFKFGGIHSRGSRVI